MDKIVVFSDQQARYDDRETEKSALKFLADFKPNLIINNGDLFDFESISKFPSSLEARQSLMADVKAGRAILRHQREAVPSANIVLVEGNHEARLQKYLREHAPELEAVPGMDLAAFCGLSDYRVDYVEPYGEGYDWHGVLIYHGTVVRKHSALSAKAEYEDAGTSGVSGHTQRLGAYFHTDRSGPHAWYESGCMCRIDPAGAPPSQHQTKVHNWQQGFIVGFADDGVWNLYAVHIHKHKFVWNGKLYTPRS